MSSTTAFGAGVWSLNRTVPVSVPSAGMMTVNGTSCPSFVIVPVSMVTFEPSGTLNTGDAGGARTVAETPWI